MENGESKRDALKTRAMESHYAWRGKWEMTPTVRIESREDLSLAYSPGVAEPCLVIEKEPELDFALTRRWNTVAVISDGTAVLGLGDIGPRAAMPVMEGKAVLFKRFAGIDAVPLCLATKDVDEIVRTVSLIAGSFGGINLEDIAAPRCFEIERRLREICDVPVFHDDQHGTAVVVCAALMNALKATGRKAADTRVVINGAGAAGISIGKLLLSLGVGDLILCDINGVLPPDGAGATSAQAEMAACTNKTGVRGTLADALRGADVFVGVSRPGLVTADMVRSMNRGAVVFAMANPMPEILPEEALAGGAAVVGTGRSDYPNQVNNLLCFPGIFKGALAVRARDITEGMQLAAAEAIAACAGETPDAGHVLPDPFEPGLADTVAKAVAAQARREGVARGLPARG